MVASREPSAGSNAHAVETDSAEPVALTSTLTAQHRAVLAFEHEWWRHAGAKEEAIREVFGLSAARYYQLLNVVIDSPDAVKHDPMLVRRLLRARDARTRARAARTFTTPSTGDTDGHPRSSETIE